MNTAFMQPAAAVVASVMLLLSGRTRVWEIVAAVASAAWLAIAVGVLVWPIRGLSSASVIGCALVAAGVVVYLRTSKKVEVTAATVVTILGGTLLVGAIGRLG